MALKEYRLGSVGPFEYDDAEFPQAFSTSGIIKSGGFEASLYKTDEVRALSGVGLKLYDDAGVIGSGAFVKDGGYFGVGVDPSYKLSIGSTDGSDQIGIYHDNANAHFKTTDGDFRFQTAEGTDKPTTLSVRSNGAAIGAVLIFSGANYGQFYQNGASTYFTAASGAFILSAVGTVHLQYGAFNPVALFYGATEGETEELVIYGFKTGDIKRSLQIGVGVDAADTASFDGLSNYYFNGNVGVGTISPNSRIHSVHNSAIDGVPLILSNEDKTDNNKSWLLFRGLDSNNVQRNYAAIRTIYLDHTAGAQEGRLDFFVHSVTGTAGNPKMSIQQDGNVGVGIANPLAKIHIDQAVDDAAIPVLILDQADISEGFINFIGSDRGVITGATNSLKSVRVEIGGVVHRLALYVDA